MEEGEYKSAYNEMAPVRCVFEKSLTSHRAKCSLARHFCLADREGYSCEAPLSSVKCRELLVKLREKSIFALKLQNINGPLPHNKEIRVQVGGLTGIARSIVMNGTDQVDPMVVSDINGVLLKAIDSFGSLDSLPYSEIMQSIKQFQGRMRRQR